MAAIMNSIPTYGVREKTSAAANADLQREIFRRDGYVVLTDVFSNESMHEVSTSIDQVYEVQTSEVGGQDILEAANDTDIIRCPLAYDQRFLTISTKDAIHSFIRLILEDNYVLMMQNAIINRPQNGHFQARWHRDLNYQHWISSRTLALSFLICIDRFFVEGGATWVLPGSHLHEEFPSDAYVRTHEVPVEASPGSVIVMDAMMFHRAGVNSTTNYVRRAVNNVVGLPFMAQQIDIPKLLKMRGVEYSQDPFLSKYLGYRWNPAPDGMTWRHAHAKRPL
jgi:ectoine hydroxylase-related dioxygenase (phytanoyl-CoA dioxygenase family)